jgi:hypothetical protein
VLLTILTILSIMLIYSLLMIRCACTAPRNSATRPPARRSFGQPCSIETRTFELGVHRMVGMPRLGIVELLFTQAASYSFPAWAIGLIGAWALRCLSRAAGGLMATSRCAQWPSSSRFAHSR